MRYPIVPSRRLAALALLILVAACGRQAQFDRNQRAMDESIANDTTNRSAPAGSH